MKKKNPRAGTTATGGDNGRTNELNAADFTPSPATLTTPKMCPRFARCNANVCPLDDKWPYRNHLRGESICLFLREAVKVGGLAVLGVHIPTKLLQQVVVMLPEIIDRYVDIKRRLERASTTPSKITRPGTRENNQGE